MKYAIIIPDGCADEPLSSLGGKTPLQAAKTPAMDEIARLAALGGSEINEAKKVLATEITALCHGRALAEEAQETARATFEEEST